MSPAARRPRRAVRPSGTVGTDESVLRSTVPVVPVTPAPSVAPRHAGPSADGGCPPEGPSQVEAAATDLPAQAGAAVRRGDASEDLWRALRSADDADQGWGRSEPSSNDERLLREKPPHW